MSEFRNLRKIFNQWGGSTASFFAYTHLSHDICPALLAPLLPLIRSDLGLSYLQSGLLISAFAITSGFSQFIGGWLADRLSRKLVIATGLAGVGLATLAVGLSSAYYPLLFILVIMGIFAGAYHPSVPSMLASHFEVERRGRVLGLHMFGGSFGFAMGPILGGLIANKLGWHFAFIILSIPALVASPLAFKRFRRQEYESIKEPVSHTPATDDTKIEAVHRRIGIGQALRPAIAIVTLAVLTQFIAGSVIAFIPMYFVDRHNIDPAYAAMYMGVLRGGGLVGGLFGGWLSDKWGRRKAIILTLVATGPILYLFTRLPVNAFLMIILVVLGLVMLMRQATVQPFLIDITPPHLRSTVFGIYFGLSMEGMSLVQPVAGHFMDIFGIAEVIHIIALISVALSLVALLLINTKATCRREPNP